MRNISFCDFDLFETTWHENVPCISIVVFLTTSDEGDSFEVSTCPLRIPDTIGTCCIPVMSE